MKRALLLVLLFFSPLYAGESADILNWGLRKEVVNECLRLGVDPKTVVAIRQLEAYKKNGVAYPYAVRVNKGEENALHLAPDGVKRVSKHVFVCRDKSSCVDFVKRLIRAGIKDFDAGLYQISYLHNGDKFRNYPEEVFDRVESGKFVCRFISKYLRKYGYHSNAVALYHSFKRDRNEKYAEKFYSVYSRLKFGGVVR